MPMQNGFNIPIWNNAGKQNADNQNVLSRTTFMSVGQEGRT